MLQVLGKTNTSGLYPYHVADRGAQGEAAEEAEEAEEAEKTVQVRRMVSSNVALKVMPFEQEVQSC